MTTRRKRLGSATAAAALLLGATACGGAAADVRGADHVTDSSASGFGWYAYSPRGPGPEPGTRSPARIAYATMRALPVPTAAQLRAARSKPVEDPYYPRTSNPEVDALHYALGLDWDGTTLFGDVSIVLRAAKATDRVRLDLSGALTADRIRLDGRKIGFSSSSHDGVVMRTGRLALHSTHTLEIAYHGKPRSTPAPSRRSDMAEGLGWNVGQDGSVYTYQEPYGAFTWYPVNDEPSDKALYDVAVTTSDKSVAVFNGTRLPSSREGDLTTSRWHLDAPVASYLTTLAIGPYRRHVETTPAGARITYWLEPRDRRLLPGLKREGGRAFDWLQTHVGPYPFSSLGVVVVGGDSAMETQTMVTMSRSSVRRSDAVLEHEMAHQWYGDTVTPRDWQGLWLNEGWAMYMQQWYEHDSHRPVYGGGMRQWRGLDQQSRRQSGPPGDYDPRTFADLNVYLGPAMMLDAIRLRIGNAAFHAMAKAWPAEHANSNVDRAEFTRWLHQETGVQFAPLIHRWLDSRRTPPLPRR